MTPSPVGIPAELDDVAFRADADPGLRLTAYLYQQVFEHQATVVTAAPGGLTLFGAPGDRFALAIPLRWGATLAAAGRDDGLVELRSVSHPGKELLRPVDALGDRPGWAECAMAVVANATSAGHRLGGMSVLVGTALPEGVGMGSDAGVTAVVASALDSLFGVRFPLADRAALGDLTAQMACLSCPDGMAMLVDTKEMTAELVPFDLVGAGLRLVIVDLGPAVGRAAVKAAAAAAAAATVGPAPRTGQVTAGSELALAAAELLRSGRLTEIGRLFGEPSEPCERAGGTDGAPGHEIAVGAACGAGALGAGVLPGGCLVALVPVDRLSPVRAAVCAASPTDRVPKFLSAVSSRGGRAGGEDS